MNDSKWAAANVSLCFCLQRIYSLASPVASGIAVSGICSPSLMYYCSGRQREAAPVSEARGHCSSNFQPVSLPTMPRELFKCRALEMHTWTHTVLSIPSPLFFCSDTLFLSLHTPHMCVHILSLYIHHISLLPKIKINTEQTLLPLCLL